jgi:hypothetical protein
MWINEDKNKSSFNNFQRILSKRNEYKWNSSLLTRDAVVGRVVPNFSKGRDAFILIAQRVSLECLNLGDEGAMSLRNSPVVTPPGVRLRLDMRVVSVTSVSLPSYERSLG